MVRVASQEVYDIILNYVNSTQYMAGGITIIPKLKTTVCNDGRYMFEVFFSTKINEMEMNITDVEAFEKYCCSIENEVDRIWNNRMYWRYNEGS